MVEMKDKSTPVELAVVALAIVSAILPAFVAGSLSVTIREDLIYGEAAAGLVLASFFATSAIFSARIGIWIDRLGTKHGLSVALIAAAAVNFLIAINPTSGPLGIGLLLGVAGVANATAQLSANVYIAQDLSIHRQGIGFAVKQSAMPAASLLAGLSIPLLALQWGWRAVFVAASVVNVVAYVAVQWALQTPVRAPSIAVEVGRSTKAGDDRGGERGDDSATANDSRPEAGELDSGRALSASDRQGLYRLAVAGAFSTAAAITLGGFFVESAVAAGIETGHAGIAFAIGSAISVLTRLLVGFWADRQQGHLLSVVAGMILLGALISVLFTLGTPAVHYIGIPLAFGAGWAWPGLFNLSVIRAVPHAPGQATGITQTGTYIGGAAGPVIFGAVAQSWSFSAAWWIATLFGVCAAIAVLAGQRSLRRMDADHKGW